MRFIVKRTEGEYEDDSPIMEYVDDTHTETKQRVNSKGEPQYYHRKGDRWKGNSVHIIGEGNINFRTEQTGF